MKIGIYGAGGVGRELAWMLRSTTADFVGYIDDAQDIGAVGDKPVFTYEQFASRHADAHVLIAVGNPVTREKLVARCSHVPFATFVHPKLGLADSVKVGRGSILYGETSYTVDVDIGEHVHINPGCTIGHDVRIGDFAILSPGVHIGGNVHIGRSVWVGIGAVIVNGTPDAPLVIGDGSVIAAGACVIKNVEARCMYAGVPAVLKKRY